MLSKRHTETERQDRRCVRVEGGGAEQKMCSTQPNTESANCSLEFQSQRKALSLGKAHQTNGRISPYRRCHRLERSTPCWGSHIVYTFEISRTDARHGTARSQRVCVRACVRAIENRFVQDCIFGIIARNECAQHVRHAICKLE